MRQLFLVSGFLLLISAPLLAADHVTLTNGDSLSGRLEGASGSELFFESELAGRVTIKWTSVRQLTTDHPLRVERAQGDPVEGIVSLANGRVTVARANAAEVTVPAGEVSAIGVTQDTGASWGGSLDGDLALSRGNTDTANIAVNTYATRSARGQKLGTYVTYIFSNIGTGADATTLARTARGGARYDRDIAGALFGFGFGDLENDPIQLLEIRAAFGGGAGVHLVDNSRTQLNLYGGVSAAHDRYTEVITAPGTTTTTTTTTPATGTGTTTAPGNSASAPGRTVSSAKNKTITIQTRTPPSVVRSTLTRDVAEYVAGQDLSSQLTDRFWLSERLTFFPAVKDLQDYRISFDTSIFAQLTDRWQWHISASDRYLRIPPAGGAVRNDLFFSSGLGVSFGDGRGGMYGGADVRPR